MDSNKEHAREIAEYKKAAHEFLDSVELAGGELLGKYVLAAAREGVDSYTPYPSPKISASLKKKLEDMGNFTGIKLKSK